MTRPIADWERRLGRRLKLRDLHILAATVRWGTMARAAKHLGMSQPSVSEAIAALEDALRVPLLDRSPRGVEPTIYGRALLTRADIVFDEIKQGVRDIEFLRDPASGEVTVGCPESLAAGFLPAVIDRTTRRYPGIAVRVVAAQPGEQEFRELRDRSVDVLLGRLFKPVTTDDAAFEILAQDTFVVVAGARSAWSRRRRIALAELVDQPWVMFRHNSVLQFNALRWSLKALPTDFAVPPMAVAVFKLKHRTLSPVVNVFLDHARQVAKSLRVSGTTAVIELGRSATRVPARTP